jgi:hypothetical protein
MDKMLVDTLGDVTITSDGATILDEMDVEDDYIFNNQFIVERRQKIQEVYYYESSWRTYDCCSRTNRYLKMGLR